MGATLGLRTPPTALNCGKLSSSGPAGGSGPARRADCFHVGEQFSCPVCTQYGWTGFQQWVGTLCTLYSLYNVYTVYQCIHCALYSVYSVYTENPNCLAWPKPRQIYSYLFWIRQNVVFNYFSVQAKLSSVLITC